MRRWTTRQRALAGGGGVLWAATVLASVTGLWQLAVVLVATSVLLAVLAMVDSRSTDARLVAKVDVLTQRTRALSGEVDRMGSMAVKQIRAARRTVEQAGTDSLDEIATFKLQLAAVVEQLVELNRRAPTDLDGDLRRLAGELGRLQHDLGARHREVLDQSGAVELSVRAQAQLVRAQVRASAVQLGSLHRRLEQVTPAEASAEPGARDAGSGG